MSRVLVIAEHTHGTLNLSTHKTLRCALQIPDAQIELVILAADPTGLAQQAATLTGVTKVLTIAHPTFADAVSATQAAAIVQLAAPYTHVLAPATTFGKDLLPRVAALLGVGQISEVMAITGTHRFVRPIYAGNALVTLDADPAQQVLATVRVASFQPVQAQATCAPIEAITLTVDLPTHTRFVERAAARSDRPDLQSAARVVSGGRALGSAEQFQLIYQLADQLGAAVGASRAAVDAGYAANDLQVGQTGKIIAPDLYLAIGISGAIQHLTGIKDARTIVAINKDSEAPIFEVADIGLIGDLFTVIPELQKQLG
jgi:electron transfer flavoprotein alpha subunit